MIGIRLTEEYEARLRELAQEARMSLGPFARKILIAYIESQEDNSAVVTSKLSRIEQCLPTLARSILRLEHKVTSFLEQVEITDPT